MKYSLKAVGFALIFAGSIDAYAMIPEEDKVKASGVARVSPRSFKDDPQYVPPLITLGKIVNVFDRRVNDGWGEMLLHTNSWDRVIANPKLVGNTQGQLLNDLPFFSNSPHPIVDNDKLCCDYSLPVFDEDISRVPPILSILRKATPDEISYFRSLPAEDNYQRKLRLKDWFKKLETLKTSNVVLSTLYEGLLLNTFSGKRLETRGWAEVKALNANRSRQNNLCYLRIDGNQINSLSILSDEYIILSGGSKFSASAVEIFNNTGADLFYADNNTTLDHNEIEINKTLFDVNGDLTFNINSAKLRYVSCKCAGNVIFRSKNKQCVIKKVKIRFANSTEPIVVSADLDLTEENPSLKIECQNANLIKVKYRKVGVMSDKEMQ